MLQVRRGCERNVITYSSLISACEKAGRWELALDLFNEMHREGCKPNVVTYNSLIAACAQGMSCRLLGIVIACCCSSQLATLGSRYTSLCNASSASSCRASSRLAEVIAASSKPKCVQNVMRAEQQAVPGAVDNHH